TLSTSPSSGFVPVHGGSVSATVTAQRTFGPSTGVQYSCTGLPSGTACGFSPPQCLATCSANLVLFTSSTTPAGTYTISVQAAQGGTTRSAPYVLTIGDPSLAYDMETLAAGKMEDISGHGNQGTISGTTNVSGVFNRARQFNGTSDYVQSPIFAVADQVTISAWVYFVGGQPAGDYGGIVSNLNGKGNTNRLLVSGADTVLWQVSIGDTTYNHFFTLPSDQRNAWHHYALVYNGTAVSLFWDGI